jgi:hypothetical protein
MLSEHWAESLRSFLQENSLAEAGTDILFSHEEPSGDVRRKKRASTWDKVNIRSQMQMPTRK